MQLEIELRKITWLDGTPHGWGNGYVKLPAGHKYYGVHYDDIPVDVHGGLTYSEQEGDYWVVGFDTAHYMDNENTWPKERVIEEAERLRDQLMQFELSLDTGHD